MDNICIVADGLVNGSVALVIPNRRALLELAQQRFSEALSTTTGDNSTNNSLFERVCLHTGVIEHVHETIIATGLEQHLKPIELPSVITLCPEEWTPESNLLTAAMKLKRVNIARRHADDIERMFAMLRANPKLLISGGRFKSTKKAIANATQTIDKATSKSVNV